MFLPVRIMSHLQLTGKILDTESFGGKKDDKVVEKIRTFVDQSLISAVAGFNNSFKCFFANLLGDAIDAIAEKRGGI